MAINKIKSRKELSDNIRVFRTLLRHPALSEGSKAELRAYIGTMLEAGRRLPKPKPAQPDALTCED